MGQSPLYRDRQLPEHNYHIPADSTVRVPDRKDNEHVPPQAGRKACTAEAQQGGAASHRNSRSAGSTAGKADSEGREKEQLRKH